MVTRLGSIDYEARGSSITLKLLSSISTDPRLPSGAPDAVVELSWATAASLQASGSAQGAAAGTQRTLEYKEGKVRDKFCSNQYTFRSVGWLGPRLCP